MLYLPPSRSTPALISFGILSLALGVVVFLFAYALFASPYWIAAAFIWGAGLGTVLAWNILWLEKPYQLYNRAVRRLVILPLRWWILAVTFGVVVMANRPFASRLRAAGGTQNSTWHVKTIENLLGGSVSDVAVDEARDARWLPALVHWVRQTRNWWVLALVPFMLALRLLDTSGEKAPVSADTYTLY
jgi:hypothetical protein